MNSVVIGQKSIDQLATEVLAVPVVSDERPPMGPSALIDWRLNGRLSFELKKGSFAGLRSQKFLLSGGPKLPNDWVLFYGAGTKASLSADNDPSVLAAEMVETCVSAGFASIGLALSVASEAEVAKIGAAVKKVLALHQRLTPGCEIGFFP